MELRPDAEDVIAWRWYPSATYTTRSAYRMFFEGSSRFAGEKPIWHAWAPLKVKFFAWLAARQRIWTAGRRHRHGLQDLTNSRLCDQEPESADHLFVGCSFTKQVWHSVFSALRITMPPHDQEGLLDWWLLLRKNRGKFKQKGIDSMVMLIVWAIWKERNALTFDGSTARRVSDVVQSVWAEGELWARADAKWMAALGWPTSSTAAS